MVGFAVLSAGPSRLLLLIILGAGRGGPSRRISRGESGKHHIWRACGYPPAVRQIFSAEIRHQGSSFLVIAGGNQTKADFPPFRASFRLRGMLEPYEGSSHLEFLARRYLEAERMLICHSRNAWSTMSCCATKSKTCTTTPVRR